MNKFLLGLVLGTLLGFLFAQSVSDEENVASAPIDIRSTPVTVAERPKLISEPVPSATNAPQPMLPNTRSMAEGSPIATLPATPTQNAIPGASQSTSPGATSAQRTPIAVPEPIREFFAKTDTHDGLTLAQTHAKLEEESDDLAWSYQMELYLQQSLARPTKSGQPLDVRVIECRSTLCEIVGFSPLENPSDDLSAAVQYMSQQPWWDFDNFNLSVAGDNSGGKYLAFLRRKR